MIDLHTHVLPGIDDGPADLAAATALVRAAADAGTRRIVATPHVSTRYPNDAARINACLTTLSEALAAEGIEVELVAGAEVSLSQAHELEDAELQKLHLGDGPYLLVESPLNPAVGDFEWMIESLARTHRIALAHPERCPAFQRDPDRLIRLVTRGAICSITASAVRGDFGGDVKRFTTWLFEQGLVHNVASDTHDLGSRGPEVLDLLAAADKDLPGLGEHVGWLTDTVPSAVLAGGPIGSPPQLRRPRRSWWRRYAALRDRRS